MASARPRPLVQAAGPVTIIIRLLAGPARDGRLVGQAEVVDTGELVAIRNAGELLALIRRLGDLGADG